MYCLYAYHDKADSKAIALQYAIYIVWCRMLVCFMLNGTYVIWIKCELILTRVLRNPLLLEGGWHPVLSSRSNPRSLFCSEEGISGMYLGSKRTEDSNSINSLGVKTSVYTGKISCGMYCEYTVSTLYYQDYNWYQVLGVVPGGYRNSCSNKVYLFCHSLHKVCTT